MNLRTVALITPYRQNQQLVLGRVLPCTKVQVRDSTFVAAKFPEGQVELVSS